MSPVGLALNDRFECVCRSELHRLKRKTASLTEEDRTQVDALALAVAQALASHLDAALDAPEGAALASTVMRLFAVGPGNVENTHETSRDRSDGRGRHGGGRHGIRPGPED